MINKIIQLSLISILAFTLLCFSINVFSQPINSRYFATLPKEVELQGGAISEGIDSISRSNKYARPKEVIQQAGLNERIRSSYSTYFRYQIQEIEWVYDLDKEVQYWEIIEEFKRDLKGTSIVIANKLKEDFLKSPDCANGCNFLEIKGDTLTIDGNIAIPITFTRKSGIPKFKDQDLVCIRYFVPTARRKFIIYASYLKFQESTWAPVLQQLNKSISLWNILPPGSVKK